MTETLASNVVCGRILSDRGAINESRLSPLAGLWDRILGNVRQGLWVNTTLTFLWQELLVFNVYKLVYCVFHPIQDSHSVHESCEFMGLVEHRDWFSYTCIYIYIYNTISPRHQPSALLCEEIEPDRGDNPRPSAGCWQIFPRGEQKECQTRKQNLACLLSARERCTLSFAEYQVNSSPLIELSYVTLFCCCCHVYM